MCGIAGFIGAGGAEDLSTMVAALAHRGPDGEGFFIDPDMAVYLGHRRLSVIDLAGGAQPMWNEDGTVGVVFNGEIYNFLDLRRDLVAAGHRFRSDHSDTEVLVHGYEEWGDDLPLRLNGMFAFAIFDRPRRRLFLARDRFGEKPLFYAAAGGLFAFASELTALVRHSRLRAATVDERAVQKFFAYGYIPAPTSLYRGCSKLPGGCQLAVDLDGGEPVVSRYWSFRVTPQGSLGDADEEALAEELRELLSRAVQRRLVSDVPLGIFLSGGLDSSTILVNAAKWVPPERINTFTIGFTEPSFDESPYARMMADVVGVESHIDVLDLDRAKDMLPSLLGRMDEPLGDPSLLPTYLLSRFARRSVTVALSGDGGDELFAGYDPFKALGPAQLYQSLVPRGLHRGLRRLVDLLPVSRANMGLDFKLRRTLTGLSYPRALWNPVWLGPVEPAVMVDLFEQPLAAEDLFEEVLSVWDSANSPDVIDRTLDFYTNFYLQDGILVKSDRSSMMCSLETRAVFLDNEVVDFCRRLPNRFKYRRGVRKYLLRKAVEKDLPPGILARRKKGFGIPLIRWLRDLDLPQAGIPGARPARAYDLAHRHCQGQADHRLFLWSWMCLERTLGGHPA